MKYTAKDFNSDMKEVTSYHNDPEKALRRLNRIKGKAKQEIEFLGLKAGKMYAQKEGKNFIAHFPIIVDDVEDDEIWDIIDSEVTIYVGDLIDKNNLDDVWGWEGVEVSKKSPKDTIDLLMYLK